MNSQSVFSLGESPKVARHTLLTEPVRLIQAPARTFISSNSEELEVSSSPDERHTEVLSGMRDTLLNWSVLVGNASQSQELAMKSFEVAYLCAQPFLPVVYRKVQKQLKDIVSQTSQRSHVLDVGGRKSHYTIGVPADITVTDLARTTEIQHRLKLGINTDIVAQVRNRRSNIREYLLDDMTHSILPDNSFECVVAVEVLEHVELDEAFVREVLRVMKPGGTFLMTTPNGDFIKNVGNPDHKRHYSRKQLQALLAAHFQTVEVDYAVQTGFFYTLGMRSWSARHPLDTVLSMAGNTINGIQSRGEKLRNQEKGTQHLVAIARKKG